MRGRITNPKKGVGVKINAENSAKVLQVIEKTRRTFSTEVNLAVEQQMNHFIACQEIADEK